ncbi:MAG: hypothetical protein ACLPVW_11095 [Terriglobales bacterium]
MADKTRPEELHDEYRKKVWEDTKSGTENFDKYLLTFSSGALGLSLAFIKDVAPIGRAVWIPSLLASWVAFLLCILVTLVSFRISILALEGMVPYLDEFYLRNNAEAFDKHRESRLTKAVEWCAWAGIILFVCGVFFTMMFVYANIREAKLMSEKENPPKPIRVEAMDFGCKPVAMTPTNEKPMARPAGSDSIEKGAKPPAMTPVRPPVPTPQPSQPTHSPKK